MRCKHCEKKLPQDANFCPNCGLPADSSDVSLALVAITKAVSLELQGKVRHAIKEMEKVVKEFPLGETWVYYGQLLVYIGELKKAIEVFENSLKDNPLNTRAHFNLGLAWMRMGKINKAINYFKKTIAINADFHLARYWLGLVYMNNSDYENAKHVFEILLRKSPDYRIVYYHLGAMALQTANYEEAIRNFQVLKEFTDDDSGIHFSTGVAYYRMGKYAKAKNEFEKTLEMVPEHIKAKNYLEDCLYELKTLL